MPSPTEETMSETYQDLNDFEVAQSTAGGWL